MADSSSSSSGGIGFVGLLTIVFITLKLLDKIAWSWWWVLSPLWVSAALVVGILAFFLGGFVIVNGLDAANDRRRFQRQRESARLGARQTTGRVIDVEQRKDNSTIH